MSEGTDEYVRARHTLFTEVLANRALNRYDAAGNTPHLSKIFSWLENDFAGGRKTIVEAPLPYFPADIVEALKAKSRDVTIGYISYGGGLNGRRDGIAPRTA
ncbi:MAG: hypothetical protein AB2L13_16575 [Spirochaetota bacterium]